MKALQHLIIGLWLCSLSWNSAAEVIAIDPTTKGAFFSSEPIMTMYWPGQKAKALILCFPGGDGRIGIKNQTRDLRSPFYSLMKKFSNSKTSSGQYDVVIFDSPYELSYPSQRSSVDHITRIKNTVEYYKNKTGLPVWLMGHSNGAISVTEFVKYLQENQRQNLIAGVIVSGSQNNTSFNPLLSIPILFIHHEEDGCINTQPKFAYENYKKTKSFNDANVTFILITGGEYEANDPCISGYHMYHDADEEVVSAIDEFLSKQSR